MYHILDKTSNSSLDRKHSLYVTFIKSWVITFFEILTCVFVTAFDILKNIFKPLTVVTMFHILKIFLRLIIITM